MKKVCVWLGAMLLLGLPASAQEVIPTAEGFVGYSLGMMDSRQPGDRKSRHVANGFLASGSANLNRTLGLVGEIGAQFRSASASSALQEAVQYRFGPRLNLRSGDGVTGFVHGMIGGMTVRGGLDDGTAFTVGAGGGLEVPATDRFSVRIFQFDYIPRRVSGDWRQGFRFGSGLVIH
jgi:hypothetical protein